MPSRLTELRKTVDIRRSTGLSTPLRTASNDLAENEAIVIGDFAENYTFVMQDSIQGFYFGNRQATIHPFSVYFKDPVSGELQQVCLAVISDYMNHTTVAVYAFQRK